MAASSAFTLPCSIQDTGVKLWDDQFHNLKKVFLAEGRGRRPNIHDVAPTNSLLMQIYLLREDGGKSYDEAAAFVQHLFPDLTFNKIRHMIAHVRTRWESFKDSEKREKFLKEEFDTSGVGLHLRNCGLTRRRILEADCQLSTSSDSTVQFLSAGLFLDLDDFRRQENKTFQDMCTWWSNLTAQSVGVSEMKKMAKAANRKRDKTAKADMEIFLSQPMSSLLDCSGRALVNTANIPTSSQENAAACTVTKIHSLNVQLMTKGRELASARRTVEELHVVNEALKTKIDTIEGQLTAGLSQLKLQQQTLEKTQLALQQSLVTQDSQKAKRLAEAKQQEENLRRRLDYYKKQGHLKKTNRLRTKLEEQVFKNLH